MLREKKEAVESIVCRHMKPLYVRLLSIYVCWHAAIATAALMLGNTL